MIYTNNLITICICVCVYVYVYARVRASGYAVLETILKIIVSVILKHSFHDR